MQQLALLPDLGPDAVEEAEFKQGNYNLARFKANRPHAYQLIVNKIRQGVSVRQIVASFREFGFPLHHMTVKQVAEENFTAPEIRGFRAAAMGRLAQVGAETAIDAITLAAEDVEAIKDPVARAKAATALANTAAVAAGIGNQNAELMTGHATMRIESTAVHVDHNEYLDAVRAAAAAKPVQDAEVVTPLPPEQGE